MKASPQQFSTYFEPFAGSACLFFALKATRAVLGDINHHLIDTYKIVKQHPRLVARLLAEFPTVPSFYYELRERRRETMAPVERAASFLYLNRTCFNGVYRTNRQGRFNVPRGRDTGGFPTGALIYRCSIALRNGWW
jgi:DNA adenine methylase